MKTITGVTSSDQIKVTNKNKIVAIGDRKMDYVSLFLDKWIIEQNDVPIFIDRILNSIFCLTYPSDKKEFLKEYNKIKKSFTNYENYEIKTKFQNENTIVLSYRGCRDDLTIKFDKNE